MTLECLIIVCIAIHLTIFWWYESRNVRELQKYMKTNKFKPHLVNRQLECIYYKDSDGLNHIYCKAKTNGKNHGKITRLSPFSDENAGTSGHLYKRILILIQHWKKFVVY